jgi:hypothetical protein
VVQGALSGTLTGLEPSDVAAVVGSLNIAALLAGTEVPDRPTIIARPIIGEGPSPEARRLIGRAYRGRLIGRDQSPVRGIIGRAQSPIRRVA